MAAALAVSRSRPPAPLLGAPPLLRAAGRQSRHPSSIHPSHCGANDHFSEVAKWRRSPVRRH